MEETIDRSSVRHVFIICSLPVLDSLAVVESCYAQDMLLVYPKSASEINLTNLGTV